MLSPEKISPGLTIPDLHLFASSQPDLNWDTPAVREAVFDVIDFWGKKGTDGFRVSSFALFLQTAIEMLLQLDVINLVSKTPGLPDAPVTDPTMREQNAVSLYTNG